MNDLSLYNAVAAQMRPGDVIALWGAADNPLHPTEILSAIIERVGAEPNPETGKEEESPSHVQVVIFTLEADPNLGVIEVECTMTPGRNGVQTNPLEGVLANYPKGSRAKWYALTPEARARFDQAAFDGWCRANVGRVHYSVLQLVEFLALPDWMASHVIPQGAEVCSVAASDALRVSRVAPDITPWKMKPSDVVNLPVLMPGVRIL